MNSKQGCCNHSKLRRQSHLLVHASSRRLDQVGQLVLLRCNQNNTPVLLVIILIKRLSNETTIETDPKMMRLLIVFCIIQYHLTINLRYMFLHYNVQASNLMTWIFDDCPDTYGSCIRQYSLFGLSLLILILAFYSCIKVFRQWNSFTFQLLPLTINSVTALILVGIYTQMEVYNIRIALLIIEIYSYFILTYGFIYMVTKKNQAQGGRLRAVKNIFIIFTAICTVSFITVIFFSAFEVITCEEDQGTGSLVLIALQVPLLFITCIYSRKSKSILINHADQQSTRSYANQEKLLNQQQQQKKVKLIQLKLIRIAFLVTFLLHIIEIAFFYIGQGDEQYTCQNNKVVVNNLLTLYILYIESFTQLFPHIMIPIIFWYLPLRYLKQAVTLYITDDARFNNGNPYEQLDFARNDSSKYIGDVRQEEKIRKKMNETTVPRTLKRVGTF